MTYELKVAGLTRQLKLSSISDDLMIAGFVVFGDVELFPFSQFPGEAAVPAFARQNGNPARSRYQDSTRFVQYPGMVLSNGMRDQEVDG